MKNKIFKTPSGLEYTFGAMIDRIIEFVNENSDYEYNIYVGSDSQAKAKHSKVTYVNAIVAHRVGKGALMFYYRGTVDVKAKDPIELMRKRIIQETQDSIEIMDLIAESELFMILPFENFEIHIDVGYNGRSREVMDYVVGWVKGLTYNYKVKPEALIAYTSADKFSKG